MADQNTGGARPHGDGTPTPAGRVPSLRCGASPNPSAARSRSATSRWSCMRRGAGAARRERRRQEHLRQAAGRASIGPTPGRSCWTASRSSSHAPLDAQRHGIAVMHQHPGLFPDLSVAENIFIGHDAARRRLGRSTSARMRREAATPARHGRPRLPAGRAAGGAAQLRAAAGRDRPRAVGQRPRADHGRADRRPVAARGRPAVRRGRRAAPAGRGDDVRRPPHGRDLPRRRPDRGAARRPPGRRPTPIGGHAARPRRPPDGRPRARATCIRSATPRRARWCWRSAACRATAPSRTSRSRCGPARSWASAGLVGSGRTEIARVLFGIDRPTAGSDPARRHARSRFASPGDAMAPASPTSPRTGSARAW